MNRFILAIFLMSASFAYAETSINELEQAKLDALSARLTVLKLKSDNEKLQADLEIIKASISDNTENQNAWINSDIVTDDNINW